MSMQQSDAGSWADEWPIIQALRDYEAKVAAEDGIWTMTDTEFKEELRKAKYDAYEEGWHGGAGWPQSEGNPYKV